MERDTYFDTLKVYLIVLVVFGHCLEVNLENRLNLAIYSTIYTFHMPLFVFISGYFSKQEKSKRVFFEKMLKLFETLIVFNVILRFFDFIHTDFTLVWLLIPAWILWYLLALIYWRGFIQITPPSIINSKKCMFSIGIICLLAGFIPIGYIASFQRSVSFFPFFLFGYLCSLNNINIRKHTFKLWHAIVLMVVLTLLYLLLNNNINSILYCATPYKDWRGIIYRTFLYLLSLIVGHAFVSIIDYVHSGRKPRIGTNTMFYFLYHAPFVILLKMIVVRFGLPTDFIYIVFYSIIIFLIVYLLEKSFILNKLINPFSYIYEKSVNRRRS